MHRPNPPWLTRRRLPVLAAIGVLALALPGTVRIVAQLREAVSLARRSEPLQRPVSMPSSRLLIVGDSTGVGTGATSPAASLAGLVAAAFPHTAIRNHARDGATFRDLLRQLDGVPPQDVVLVLAGGNDVIRLHDLDEVRQEMARALQRAGEIAPHVIVMPAGNVGNAPFFFSPLSWLMSRRARRLHQMVRDASAHEGAIYVSLFRERGEDPFAQVPALNASDGLHPSDAGYRLWMHELLRQSELASILSRRIPAPIRT